MSEELGELKSMIKSIQGGTIARGDDWYGSRSNLIQSNWIYFTEEDPQRNWLLTLVKN